MLRWRGLASDFSLGSAMMWPNIGPIGIHLFRHWPTLTMCQSISLRNGAVQSRFVSSPTRSCFVGSIILDSDWYIGTARTPPNFVSTLCKNALRSKHVLTNHYKTFKPDMRASLTNMFASSHSSEWSNTYLLIGPLNNSLQPLVSPARNVLETAVKNRRTPPDSLNNSKPRQIGEDGVHHTVSND